MARTPTPPLHLRPLAPKPAPDSGPSPSSPQSKTPSHRPVFNDFAAGPPVTMGDEPYRNMCQRADSPSRHMTIEQLVDTRLCVSALSPEQCHQMMRQLSDRQIKNAVYDRALCFPFDPWTEKLRQEYGRQVQQDIRVVTSFDNVTNHMENMFATWRGVYFFNEGDYDNVEAHVKGYLSPSIDNIGVYSTFSDYTVTKINGLAALLKIGQTIVDIPILISKKGLTLFEYDPLSRAVANILSTATNDATRREILDLTLEGEFMELTKRATSVGLFPGLLKAVTTSSDVRPYNVPRGKQLGEMSNKRASTGQLAPAAKRSKASQDDQHVGQADANREGAPTSGSSRASSHQPRGVADESGASPSGPRNPFSRPASAGPVAKLFAKSGNSTPNTKIKVEDEQIEPSPRALSQGTELQDIAKGATEYQPESQDGQQASNGAQVQDEQGEGSGESDNTGKDAEQPPTEEQEGQGAEQQLEIQPQPNVPEPVEFQRPAYDDMLVRIEDAVFRTYADETTEVQLERAPAVVSLIEGTVGTILRQFQSAARACERSGRHDHFVASLKDTAFALLWVLESCALPLGGTALALEVSRTLSRDALVGALWGSVRLASADECLDLLKVRDPVSIETFCEKLERIIRQLDEMGVAGFGDLRFIVGNMRSGISLPAQNTSSHLQQSST